MANRRTSLKVRTVVLLTLVTVAILLTSWVVLSASAWFEERRDIDARART